MEIKPFKYILPIIITATIVLAIYYFFKLWYIQLLFSDLKFENEINPIEVINLFITIIIAVVFGYYLTKKNEEQRFLKKLLIDDLFRIEEEVSSFEKTISTEDRIEVKTAFEVMQTLRIKINRFEKTASLNNFTSDKFKELDQFHTELFKASTTSEGELVELDKRKEEINEHCNNIVNTLREIISLINKK